MRGLAALACLAWLSCSASASADADPHHYALIVTGASGGPEYAAKYARWRRSLVDLLRGRFDYPADHVVLLGEDEGDGVGKATRENVRAALAGLSRRIAKGDLLLVMLIGHGTSTDGDDGKFNLVGPDLTAEEWAALVKPVAGRLLFVNTASGSFPFMRRLSGPGRLVVTATDSAAQEFETVFAEHFIDALANPDTDADRNGKTSVWEAFAFASARVRNWFEQLGQLPTERPLLDDNGDGAGREAEGAGTDGATAQVTYLQADRPVVVAGDAELTALLRRRAELDSAIEVLKARKPLMPAEEYDAELERLLLELARLDQQVRARRQ